MKRDKVVVKEATRTRDKPKQTWMEAIKNGMIVVN